MKTANYNVRLDPVVKVNAEKTFAAFGLNLSEAITIFLHKSIMENGLPFEVRARVPNAEFQAAIDECEAMVRGEIPMPPTMTVDEIFAELEREIADEI